MFSRFCLEGLVDTLILIGGLLHLATLLGSAQVPKEMNFKEELPKLNPLLRHWVLTAGGYIVLKLVIGRRFGIRLSPKKR